MPKCVLHRIQLMLCGLSALVILTGVLTADNRATTAPGATTRPSDAKIAEARAILARAIAPPAKLTDATTKRIKELIGKLGSPVWKEFDQAIQRPTAHGGVGMVEKAHDVVKRPQ